VGIVFCGVPDRLTHYFHSPFPKSVDGDSVESARLSLGYTCFHLGISQRSIFAISGLIVAYFQFLNTLYCL
ncbi:glycine/betaine ABC transporter permease, partial [Staphylococcus pseudintermedius]|uniref:BCCT family transporter n=1 Tax=Staphylococcus pseudintermedius TaxID=283734 RepID=UPI000E383281